MSNNYEVAYTVGMQARVLRDTITATSKDAATQAIRENCAMMVNVHYAHLLDDAGNDTEVSALSVQLRNAQ